MSFQFQCPQGHLLEGDESHAGQTCQCPNCGILFIIPMPLAAPAPAAEPEPETEEPTPHLQTASAAAPAVDIEAEPEPKLLHIPCPNGHKLETPLEMLEQDVLCPHCGAKFRLREKNSVEFKRKRREEEERRAARAGKLWLNIAIGVAVLILLGLIGMIVL